MKDLKIIACLGYKLNAGGQLNPILENRLKDVVLLVEQNPGAVVVLMGKSTFLETGEISEAGAMAKYLRDNFADRLNNTEIIKEEHSTSAVEQICILRDLTRSENAKYKNTDLTIVSSEVFSDRVKMYVEYIFGSTEGVQFVGSTVPDENKKEFIEIEEKKLAETKEWLSKKEKGDYESILQDQKDFEEKIKKGIVSYP